MLSPPTLPVLTSALCGSSLNLHTSGDSVSGSTPVEPEHELLPNLLQIVKEEDKNGSTMHNDDVGDGTCGVPTTTD